jgi:hypothetical protein
MEEEASLVRKVDKDVEVALQELGNKPQLANQIIKVLNSKTKEELNQSGFKDRTNTIMEVERVFTKRNLIQQVWNKLTHLQKSVQWFNNHYKRMVEMGLPEIYGKKGLLPFPEYQPLLVKSRENANKFKGATRVLKGKTIVDLLDEDFFLLWHLRNLFDTPPTYERYTEVDISYKKMISCKYPSSQEWERLMQLQ